MSVTIRRINAQLGTGGIESLLGDQLEPTDLQSLMLQVYRRVAKRRNPKSLLAAYRTSGLCHPSTSDVRELLEWDRIAFASLPNEFESIELSPLCPLGAVSVLAPIVQDWIVTTIRNVEVTSDPTNVLALECAVRRQKLNKDEKTRNTTVNLAASQKTVRPQYDNPKAKAHFRLFSMCTAGRDTGNFRFEASALSEHARFYLKSLRSYLGEKIPLHVSVFDLGPEEAHRSQLLSNVVEDLSRTTKHLSVELENKPDKAKGYYKHFRFHLYATSHNGDKLELADGGDTDWTQQLLGNRKERLFTSGLGSERLCDQFGKSGHTIN